MYGRIIVDITHSEVDKLFDYKVDERAKIGMRVTIPFGSTYTTGVILAIAEDTEVPQNKIRSVTKYLDEVPTLTLECLQLAEFMRGQYHIPMALALRQMMPSEMRKVKVKEKTVRFVSLVKDISPLQMVSSLRKGSTSLTNCIGYLAEKNKVASAELNEKFSGALNSLLKKGFVVVEEEKVQRSPYKSINEEYSSKTLTTEQQNAMNILSGEESTYLLHGVTGSGKTLVYLTAIEEQLNQNKTAIMLVPEIALTPQMLTQLRARFGEKVSILHSGLSMGERFDEWSRLRKGEAVVCIGARSAIFAPMQNIGLIIVDEEHDSSYDSHQSPRYKTIEIAEFRRDFNKSKLILGSATPSIESYSNALSGKYKLIEMKNRINKQEMPEIILADMREDIKRGNSSYLSRELQNRLVDCISKGHQAILFLNRRGYSNQVMCKSCGHVPMCKTCDISLNYHSETDYLKCHYCGTTYRMITECPQCGSNNLSYGGIGTQRVVLDLKKLLPNARIIRMDNDTTSTKEGHFEIINKFKSRQADILVGTQMIAKGHDFEGVTLVGIIDGDMSLYFSDYRAEERTFQLLTQVAGRSGRAKDKGEVVLQTYNPKHPIFNFALNYDYKSFYERENMLRKSTHFPPYATIIRIMVEGEKDEDAMNGLKQIFLEIEKIYLKNLDSFYFFNKMRSPIKRIKNKYRYQVLLRLATDAVDVREQIFKIAMDREKQVKVNIYIEENPNSLS